MITNHQWFYRVVQLLDYHQFMIVCKFLHFGIWRTFTEKQNMVHAWCAKVSRQQQAAPGHYRKNGPCAQKKKQETRINPITDRQTTSNSSYAEQHEPCFLFDSQIFPVWSTEGKSGEENKGQAWTVECGMIVTCTALLRTYMAFNLIHKFKGGALVRPHLLRWKKLTLLF